jgi:predicted AlkP superfamily pyrophosphatase or phosphodiesterase
VFPRLGPGALGAGRTLASGAALLLVLGPARPAAAWGFTAHRMVTAKAIALLPPGLRPLFAANAAHVVEHAIDPDLWRGAGQAGEGPNHFLDMDAFGAFPFPDIPRKEAEHRARHGAVAVEKGRLPWRVGEAYGELVAAFRAGEPARILAAAAVLSHYAGDAHVPLHAVVNYDGQLTGQTGFHNRWEGEMVDRYQRQLEADVRPAPVRRVADPVAFTFGVLLDSFSAAESAFAADRECAGPWDLAETPFDDRYDDLYYSKLYARQGGRLRARLAASATDIASLWVSAWDEAGRPAFDASFRVPYVRRQSRAILVSLDGSAAGLLDDAVARGIMPSLARLRERGATATSSLSTLPAKTAAGHAALFTGAWSDRNGIAGNDVSVPGASVLESDDGFTSTHLTAEPLWVAAARQGLDASVVSATQTFPFSPYLEERRFGGNYGRGLTLMNAYQGVELPEHVYSAADLPLRDAAPWLGELPAHDGTPKELEIALAGARIDGLLYDDPGDPTRGLDTLYLGLDRDPKGGIVLKPSPPRGADASGFGGLTLRIGGGDAAAYFRLFELSPDGSRILLYRSGVHLLRSSKPRVESAAYEASGGFVGNGAGRAYERGELGPPLWKGGDGTAERRYLESVALVARQFTRLVDFALDRTARDLLVTYLPYPDEALHVWYGYLVPSLPGHDPALAARLRGFLDEVMRIADGYVGHLAARADERTILAVAGDHGMAGASRLLRPNVALVQAGLATLDARGGIDLARTRAVYFPGNSGFVLVNRRSRPGGIVAPDEEDAVRAAAAAALRGVRDGLGRPVVLDLIDPRAPGREPSCGGPTGGDLYLSLAPGYDVSASPRGPVVEEIAPRGVHGLDPERAEMQAGFVVAGPGVAAGARLGPIRQIDVAPTLAALLGLDPPAQATGVVLTKALARH